VYVPPVPKEKRRPDFHDFVEVMARLRGENGCPWDRKQTHQSLKKYILEESYEVLEAIDLQDDDKLCEELGDLMLQVLFHAQLGAEEGRFDIRDVIEGIVTKLIRRHPHVFGEVEVANAEEVLVNWDKIKVQEKEQAGKEERISVLGGVPRQLPALMRAHEISKRAARSGFDWDNIDGVMDKLSEEIQELEEAAGTGDKEHLQEELGDILFVLVSVARHHKLDPEEALRHATDKFMRRFHYVEDRISEMGKSFEDFNPQELDALWNEAKKEGR
jgi:tetrapyrrole methylase family protein/MazG family protein